MTLGRDALVFVGLSGMCGVFAAAHIAAVVGVFRHGQRWGAVLGLVFPPLAITLAFRAGLHVRAAAATLAFVGYGALRLFANS